MEAKITWKHGLSFDGLTESGFTVPLGADPAVGGENDGPRPLELIALGLAGCTGMDVVSILQKKRQDVTSFQVLVHAERAAEHPRVFTHIVVEYLIEGRQIDPAAVERAIELSATKYCPAQTMLEKATPIEHRYTITEAA